MHATVLIVIEWSQEKGAFYNFSIEPQATIINTNNTFAQIEVVYNIIYKVNVEVNSTDCGPTSTIITLNYGIYIIFMNACIKFYIMQYVFFILLNVIIHSINMNSMAMDQ